MAFREPQLRLIVMMIAVFCLLVHISSAKSSALHLLSVYKSGGFSFVYAGSANVVKPSSGVANLHVAEQSSCYLIEEQNILPHVIFTAVDW
jgi:hypothetical protein